jgi:hypothetical protein
MSMLPPIAPEAEQEGAMPETPEAHHDRIDPVIAPICPADPSSDETFVEELLRDAYLPRDRKP